VSDDYGSNVRFGSKADIRTAKSHVRFTPESGHLSARLWRRQRRQLTEYTPEFQLAHKLCFGVSLDAIDFSPRALNKRPCASFANDRGQACVAAIIGFIHFGRSERAWQEQNGRSLS
jgi:hypothetical protein